MAVPAEVGAALNRIAKLEARLAYSFRKPAKPATPGPHGLHQWRPAITESPQPAVTPSHQPKT